MGLVTGVDDGAFEGGLEADLLLEEVGPLGDLEHHLGRPVLGADLAGPGEDLTGHEPGDHVADKGREGDRPVDQVVLVGAVRVALAVGVVLVDDDLLTGGQQTAGGLHRTGQYPFPGLVKAQGLEGVGALGGGELRVGVVDVVPGAVGQDGVDQVGLHLGRRGVLPGEAPGVAAGRLVLEVPPDLAVLVVGVDQHRRRHDGVAIERAPEGDAVFGLDAAHLGDGHELRLQAQRCASVSGSHPAPGHATDSQPGGW